MVGLIDKMIIVSDFVEDANRSPEKLKSLEDTIGDLLDEVTKCSNFVKEYLASAQSIRGNRTRFISGRLLIFSWSGRMKQFSSSKYQKKIENYMRKFDELQVRLNTAAVFQVLDVGEYLWVKFGVIFSCLTLIKKTFFIIN